MAGCAPYTLWGRRRRDKLEPMDRAPVVPVAWHKYAEVVVIRCPSCSTWREFLGWISDAGAARLRCAVDGCGLQKEVTLNAWNNGHRPRRT